MKNGVEDRKPQALHSNLTFYEAKALVLNNQTNRYAKVLINIMDFWYDLCINHNY